jgi:hypothetical protein
VVDAHVQPAPDAIAEARPEAPPLMLECSMFGQGQEQKDEEEQDPMLAHDPMLTSTAALTPLRQSTRPGQGTTRNWAGV